MWFFCSSGWGWIDNLKEGWLVWKMKYCQIGTTCCCVCFYPLFMYFMLQCDGVNACLGLFFKNKLMRKCFFQSLAKAIRDVWPPLDGLLGLLRHLERPTHRGQRLRRPKGKDSRVREAEQCGPGHGKGEQGWKKTKTPSMYDGRFFATMRHYVPNSKYINFLHVHSSPTKLQWQNKLTRLRHNVKFEFPFIIDLLEIFVSLTI